MNTVFRCLTAAIALCTNSIEAHANPIEQGKQLCRELAPRSVVWKDPTSLLIGTVFGGQMEVIDFANTKLGARLFYVPINAKNSYGAYVGEKSVRCYTSEDGLRVLKVES